MSIEELQLATFSEEQINEISSKPVRKFVAQFIVPGVCGYKEQNDDVLLKDEVLQNMSDSFMNRAVIVSPHDITITKDNIMQKSVGRVVDVYKGEDSDKWFVKFDVWDTDALNKIDEGYKYVSCAYVITNYADGGVYNGIDYNREVLDGFYHHLAITNNPRYNDSDIIKMNDNNSLIFLKFNDIVEFSEEVEHKGENKMFGLKRQQVSIDKDVFFQTNAGEFSIEDLVSKVNQYEEELQMWKDTNSALEKEKEELAKENARLSAEVEEFKRSVETEVGESPKGDSPIGDAQPGVIPENDMPLEETPTTDVADETNMETTPVDTQTDLVEAKIENESSLSEEEKNIIAKTNESGEESKVARVRIGEKF